MKPVTLGALIAVCCFPSHAQISARLNPLRDGTTEIRVRNDAAISLIAFAIRANDRNHVFDRPLVVYVDTEIDSTQTALSEGQEWPIREARRFVIRDGKQTSAVFDEPIVTAGIFSDGTTSGDAILLNGLLLRRRNMLQAIELALALLSDAGSQNVPRNQVIALFNRMADSARRWYVPSEQHVGRTVYQSIVEKLLHLPPMPVGSPFPPTDFVAQETARLNRHRIAILASQPDLADATVRNTP